MQVGVKGAQGDEMMGEQLALLVRCAWLWKWDALYFAHIAGNIVGACCARWDSHILVVDRR